MLVFINILIFIKRGSTRILVKYRMSQLQKCQKERELFYELEVIRKKSPKRV